MPQEFGFVTKNNKNQVDTMSMNQTERIQLSDQQEAYKQLQDFNNSFQTNTRKDRKGNEIEDSIEMKNVKTALNKITSYYANQEIASTKEDFDGQLKSLLEDYGKLISSCDTYISTKSNLWKKISRGQSYARLEMVKQIRAKASTEKSRLKSRATDVFNQCNVIKNKNENENDSDRPLWVNVLAEVRTEHLDLDKAKFENIKDSIEIKYAITKDEKTVAYLKEDRFIKPVEENTRYQEQIALLNEDKKIKYRRLSRLMVQFIENGNLDYYANLYGKEMGKLALVKNEISDEFLKWAVVFANMNEVKELNKAQKDSETLKKDLLKYAECYYNHAFQRKFEKKEAKISEGSNITSRNVATYRLAELLGLSNLVPAAKKIKYLDARDSKNGVIIEAVQGEHLSKVEEKINYSDQQLLQINSIQIFDFIAGQVNRKTDNIMVSYDDESNVTDIKLIDNEMSFGKRDYNSMLRHLGNKSKPEIQQVDEQLYDQIMSITDEVLDYVFADNMLSKGELKALKSRLHGIQKWLEENKESVVISKNNPYNRETIEKQKDKYLKLFMEGNKERRKNPGYLNDEHAIN